MIAYGYIGLHTCSHRNTLILLIHVVRYNIYIDILLDNRYAGTAYMNLYI